MGAEIDRLEMQVEAQATKANNALDRLVGKLNTLSTTLSNLNSSGLSGLANGISKFAQASAQLSNVKTSDFTRLAKNIEKLASLNTQQIYNAASAMRNLSTAINNLGSVSANSLQVAQVAKDISKLGGANVQKAIDNLPALATAMRNLMTTLSQAPQVSSNVIQLTTALANLAAQGSGVGAASNGLVGSLNHAGAAMSATTKKAHGFSSIIGLLYQKYFLLIRGANKLGDAIKSSMEYVEILNYFNAAWEQVTKNADLSAWEELGYESAEVYAASFLERAKEVTSEMTGFDITATGMLEMSGTQSLGIDPSQVMNYQAMFGQMASSIDVTAENSALLSEVLTKIGADLGSVKNMDFNKTWTDMASGLAGMSRTLDKYGVNIRNVNLQEKLHELGINANITALNQNDKALLRTIILLDSTRYAWGDLADTINQPANQLRLLQSNFNNLARTIGNLFLPIISRVLPYINALVVAVQRLFSWVSSLLGIDISGITQGVGGGSDAMSNLLDSVDNTTAGLEEAEEAAESLKRQLQGFDELNVITTPQENGSDDIDAGGISPALGAAFGNIASEYLQVWDEAFAEMENRTQEIADSIYNALQPVRDIISDFAVGDFFAAGQDTSNLVISITDFFTQAIDEIDWYGIGQNIGDFLAGIDWLGILDSVGELIWEAITGAIELWTGSFDTAPVETTIVTALAGMRLSGITISSTARIVLSVIASAPNIAQTIGEALGIEETIFGDSIEDLSWSYIFERLQEGFTDDNGEFSITQGINFTLEVLEANVTGTAELLGLSDSDNSLIRFLFSPTDWETAWGNLEAIASDAWSSMRENSASTMQETSDTLSGSMEGIRIFWGEKWGQVKGKASENLLRIGTIVAVNMQNTKNIMLRSIEGVRVFWGEKWGQIRSKLSETWGNMKSVSTSSLNFVRTKIASWYYNAKDFFGISHWDFEGVREGLRNAFNSAIDTVKQIWNNFANWLNGMLTWTIEPIVVAGQTVFTGATINLGIIPTFATGGFPEDGLFMANHGELVGKFSNGKTVVANNEQITQGIAIAVQSANQEQDQLLRQQNVLLQKILEKEFGITYDDIGKASRKYAQDFYKRTGKNAYI